MNATKILLSIAGCLTVLTLFALLWGHRSPSEKEITLLWSTGSNPMRESQVEAFNHENPDLRLRWTDRNSTFENMVIQSTTGQGPDLFDFYDGEPQAYQEAGVIWDVTEQARTMGFAISDDGSAQSKVGLCFGRQYGYFCNIGVPILIYNRNVFDESHISYPSENMDWNAFLNLAVKVNAPTSERGIYAVAGVDWRTYFSSLHGEFFDQNGLLRLNSPEIRNSFQWQKDLIFKYNLLPTRLETETRNSRGGWAHGIINQFAEGHFAMIAIGDWSLIAFTEAYLHQKKSGPAEKSQPLRIGAVPLPHADGLAPCYKINARMIGINRFSPRREQALRVLQFFAGSAYSTLLNQQMDALPGNPEYVDAGVEEKYPDLSRIQLHETTRKALANGYAPRNSPFLSLRELEEILKEQVDRLESDPNLNVDDLLRAAEVRAKAVIQRNLQRDPELKKEYEICLSKSGVRRSE